MKKITFILIAAFVNLKVSCQTPYSIVAQIFKVQKSLKRIAYSLDRTDTLVDGTIRKMKGEVTIIPDNNDEVFGFLFNAKLEGDSLEKIYDGHMGYVVNKNKKSFTSTANPTSIKHFLLGGGGWLVLPDLVRLDTSNNIDANLTQDENFYYLTLKYDDIKQYDVINRFKQFTVSKSLLLPIAMRSHQETNGKVQDLYYHVDKIDVKDSALKQELTSANFLSDYKEEIVLKTTDPTYSLNGQVAPNFILNNFQGFTLALDSFKGKVVLLDFWEVWCGPCMESLPKIEKLYANNKSSGLKVIGIINDTKQLESSKQMVLKKGFTFPMLIGNNQLKKDYKLSGAVPLYILIDRAGIIRFISFGYSTDIEAAVANCMRK